jgi:hypothetical protein
MPNSISGSVPAVWSKYMAKTFDAKSVMSPLVNRSVEGDLANSGDTVHVQKWGNVSVTDYTTGTDFSVQTVSLTDTTLVLNQQKAFQFVIDSIEAALSQLDLVKGFSERAMIAMAQVVDDRLFTHYADVQAGNTIGSTSVPITLTPDNVYGYFVAAGLLLDNANVPAESRVAVIDPTSKSFILRSPDFIKNTATGDSVIRNGQIGQLAGFDVVVSNRITTVTSTKPIMFFTPDFISMAMRISPDRFETYKPEKQFGTGVKGLSFYGTKVFNPAAGVTLYKAV